ncbi:phage tail protein [Paenibacillus eucommiae]|uniref:Phage minor structural protein n=1 Tax=Paenibacillus eucommiae TaxID=1355755 RepID=A0ABS4IY86_9BACL|nr:phage tail protein [Paenibacillus eucommiae]MBP1992555.1 phage minor structural protein [Paenibacillus eucommiae]
MNFPIIYDQFESAYDGFGLAILENADEVLISDDLNGMTTLSLTLPRSDEKWQYIQEDAQIKMDGDIYIVRTFDEIRDESGMLISNIQCEHVFFELLSGYVESIIQTNTTAQAAGDALILGTRFKLDATRIAGNHDFAVEDCTPVSGLKTLLEMWDCDFHCSGLPDPDGKFRITLYPEYGNDTGVQFRYGKNQVSIKKYTDAQGIVTRLYVYGKDKLSIAGATGNVAGTSYIDSPYIGNYRIPKASSVTFGDIEDKDKLYQAGLDHLTKLDTPKVTYEMSVVELKALTGYDDSESFGIGDTIRVIDEELGIDILARILRYNRYPREPWRSPDVVLGNFRPGIEDALVQFRNVQKVVEKTTYKGRVNTFWLDGIINTLQNQIKASGSYANAEVIDGKGMLFENTDISSPDYGALYIGPNILAIASNKVGGSWNWRTFGKGSGFTADELNAGIINSSLVKIMSASGDTVIDGDVITSTRDDKKSQTVISGSGGIKVKKNIGTPQAPIWQDRFYADTNGDVQLMGLVVGSNVQMGPNATITWGNVVNQPFIPSTAADVGALPSNTPIPVLPSYIQSTKITSTTIESPTISGGVITGAVLQTSNTYPRIQIDSNGLYSQSSGGSYHGLISATQFAGPGAAPGTFSLFYFGSQKLMFSSDGSTVTMMPSSQLNIGADSGSPDVYAKGVWRYSSDTYFTNIRSRNSDLTISPNSNLYLGNSSGTTYGQGTWRFRTMLQDLNSGLLDIGNTNAVVTANGRWNFGNLNLTSPVYTSASSGGASALPATPMGYIEVKINGNNRRIPYY